MKPYDPNRIPLFERRLESARSQLDMFLARGEPKSICIQQANHCGHIREELDRAKATDAPK